MVSQQSPLSITLVMKNLIEKMSNKPDYLDIFSNWAAVVGEDMSILCVPHRAVNAGKDKILVLKTIKGHGLEIQHEACKILDLVNKFLGKKTFSRIKVIQTDKTKEF
ncbi:MAG: DUF721 domain-containing protein [Holosporaceae bacterium]|jgi:hypothetical protein|nr:DUF721 domain-containing protein [Holosporaceae bacterium]